MMRRLFAWLNRRPAPSWHEVPHQPTVNGIPLSTTEPSVVDASDLYPDAVGTVTFTPVCLAEAAFDAYTFENTMARVDEIIARTGPVDLDDVLAKCGVLTDENLRKAQALIDVARAAHPSVNGAMVTASIGRLELHGEGASMPWPCTPKPALDDEDALWVEAIARNDILDDLERHRHRNRTHPATPDTYFWGITVAERLIRGERP